VLEIRSQTLKITQMQKKPSANLPNLPNILKTGGRTAYPNNMMMHRIDKIEKTYK